MLNKLSLLNVSLFMKIGGDCVEIKNVVGYSNRVEQEKSFRTFASHINGSIETTRTPKVIINILFDTLSDIVLYYCHRYMPHPIRMGAECANCLMFDASNKWRSSPHFPAMVRLNLKFWYHSHRIRHWDESFAHQMPVLPRVFPLSQDHTSTRLKSNMLAWYVFIIYHYNILLHVYLVAWDNSLLQWSMVMKPNWCIWLRDTSWGLDALRHRLGGLAMHIQLQCFICALKEQSPFQTADWVLARLVFRPNLGGTR